MSYEENNVEEYKEACRISCEKGGEELNCKTACVFYKMEDTNSPYGYIFLGREIKEIDKFTVKSEGEARVKASEFARKNGMYTVLDFKRCRLLLDDNGEVVASTCGMEDGLIGVDIKLNSNRNIQLYLNKKKVDKWRKEYVDDPHKYIAFHPLVLGIAMLNYRYVNPKEVSTICLDNTDVKGITIEDYGDEPTINLAWINFSMIKMMLGEDEREIAKDILHTALHEYSHYLDALNTIEYEGSWWGEHPLQAWAVAVTGRPIPAGREKTSEYFAKMVLRHINDKFPEIIDMEVKSLKEYVENVFWGMDIETVEEVKKTILEFQKWLEDRFGDIFTWDIKAIDEGEVGVTCYPIEWSDKYRKYLQHNLEDDYKEILRLEKESEEKDNWWEYCEKKEEINIKAISKLFNEFCRERNIKTDLIKVEKYTDGGGFVKLSMPILKIKDLYWECDPADADTSLPSEY